MAGNWSEDGFLTGNSSNNSLSNDTNCQLPSADSILSRLSFQLVVYSLYSVIFVVAVIGNGFVCYIVLSSPRMRTVTNYFILNLAIGDMLTTVLCVPFTVVALMRQNWPFGAVLCPLVNYLQALAVFVSAYTLVAISIDRYIVIMWPLKPRITKQFAAIVIGLVWSIAGITVLPSGVFASLLQPDEFYKQCDMYICMENYEQVGQSYSNRYTEVLMLLQYVIPSLVLLLTYTNIATVIWGHRIPGEAENSRDQRMARSKRKMIKMMVTVVVVYTICWLPFNMIMIFLDSADSNLKIYLYFGFHSLAVSHACYNPIIYCYMNSRFKDGLFVFLRGVPWIRGRLRQRPGLNHTESAGTDTTVLHRNNTSTTYISMRRKTRMSNQLPVRSARFHPQEIIDEQM